MPAISNLILDILPDRERQALALHLTPLKLEQHQILFNLHQELTHVYFVNDAAISLTIPLSTGEIIETAMVGRDGIVGAYAALNGRMSLNRGVVQIGGSCLACPVEPLKPILREHDFLRSLFVGHEQVLFAQAQQSAACNATHVIESRFARWLLRAADLHGEPELPLTQEYIAQMLGVRRTTVTLIASTLQHAGMITYRRGHIKLNDITALQDTACECYEKVKTTYSSLLYPSNRPQKILPESVY